MRQLFRKLRDANSMQQLKLQTVLQMKPQIPFTSEFR